MKFAISLPRSVFLREIDFDHYKNYNNWQKIRESNVFTKLLNSWFDEIYFLVIVKFSFFHIAKVEIAEIPSQVSVEFTKLLYISRFFEKISVKTTSLVKRFTVKLISRNVIQKFRKLHTVSHSVEITRILSQPFLAKISWKQQFY